MNNLQIIGNLTKDAEVKELGGKKCMVFTIAVNDKDSKGEKSTMYVNCYKYSEKTGVVDYLKKGGQVFASGKLVVKDAEKDGKRYVNINLLVNTIELLGGGERVQQSTSEQPAPTPQQPEELPF